MTVTSTAARITYVGTGSVGPYAYAFRILNANDLVVTVTDAAGVITNTLAYPADFSVSGVGNGNGGSITLTAALASGETLAVRRELAIQQATDLRNLGTFHAGTHEDALDRQTMVAQQLDDLLARALVVPATDDDTVELPTSANRADKFLAFDGDGDPVAVDVAINTGVATVSPFMAAVNNQTTAAAAQAALGVSSFARTLIDDASAGVARATMGGLPFWVGTMAELRALAGSDLSGTVSLGGYHAVGDEGMGIFRWIGSDSSTDDGGLTIQPNSGGVGRWNRMLDGKISGKYFGSFGDFSHDDTVTLQNWFDAIEARTTQVNPTVNGVADNTRMVTVARAELPPGNYLISEEITGPAWLELQMYGATITQLDDTKDVFFSDDVRTWRIYNGRMVGGRHTINVGNANIDQTNVLLMDCELVLSQSYAIMTQAYGGTYHHLSMNLTARKCRFSRVNGIAKNCCDSMIIDDSWGYVDKANFSNLAAFVNKDIDDGTFPRPRLFLNNFFGVPTMGTGGGRLANVRWFDNYGEIAGVNCRFGGEDAGMSGVWHSGVPSTTNPYYGWSVSFDKCWWFTGPNLAADSAVLVIKGQIPTRFTMKDCLCSAANPFIANPDALNIATYMSNYETATSQKAYDHFAIIIEGNEALAPDFTLPRIPLALRPYILKAKQTKVRRAAAQACAAAYVNNFVSFDNLDYDNVGGFAIAAPTHLKMPTGATRMRIVVNAQIAGGGSYAGGDLGVLILDSSSAIVGGQSFKIDVSASDIFLTAEADVDSLTPDDWWLVSVKTTAAGGCSLLKCRATTTPLDYIL